MSGHRSAALGRGSGPGPVMGPTANSRVIEWRFQPGARIVNPEAKLKVLRQEGASYKVVGERPPRSPLGYSLGYWTLRWAERSPPEPNAARPPKRPNPA